VVAKSKIGIEYGAADHRDDLGDDGISETPDPI